MAIESAGLEDVLYNQSEFVPCSRRPDELVTLASVVDPGTNLLFGYGWL